MALPLVVPAIRSLRQALKQRTRLCDHRYRSFNSVLARMRASWVGSPPMWVKTLYRAADTSCQLACRKLNNSVFLGRTLSGHHHHYSMLKQEFPPELDWCTNIHVYVNLGYLGMRSDYGGDQLDIPTKKPRKSPKNPNPPLRNKSEVSPSRPRSLDGRASCGVAPRSADTSRGHERLHATGETLGG
jgi:hypothetical protein